MKKKSHVIRLCLQASFHLHHSSVSHFRISALLLIRMWTQTIQAAADSRVSMEVFWCVQDTAMILICSHKSAWHSHQDEVNLHIWSGLPCLFGSGECLVPTDSLSLSLFLLCLSHPIVDVRTHLVTRIRAFQSPSSKLTTSLLYWICTYYLPSLSFSFFTVILIPCTRSGLCFYLSI